MNTAVHVDIARVERRRSMGESCISLKVEIKYREHKSVMTYLDAMYTDTGVKSMMLGNLGYV